MTLPLKGPLEFHIQFDEAAERFTFSNWRYQLSLNDIVFYRNACSHFIVHIFHNGWSNLDIKLMFGNWTLNLQYVNNLRHGLFVCV